MSALFSVRDLRLSFPDRAHKPLFGTAPRNEVLKGVSLMGVPIPGAWLGGLKNVDLVQEFGDAQGFWKGFADGVEDIRVEEGALRIRLKE